MRNELTRVSQQMVEIGRDFHHRGWVLGTSGNFSAVVGRNPLRLAVTRSGVDKSSLTPAQVLEVGAEGQVLAGDGYPSAETRLHVTIVGAMEAGAVLHTHSVWSNLLSERHGREGGVRLEGHEMLKGLRGVETHLHTEWIPVLENSQDYQALSQNVAETLKWYPECHGFLLRRHGLYSWGDDLAEAKRHIEILEYLLEVSGRMA